MKFKLTVQSLAPLFVLLLVQSVGKWNLREEYNIYYKEFIQDNWFVIVYETLLVVMVLIAIVSYFSFNNWKRYGQETHNKILKTTCINEHSLTFFMTYVIPLMVSDVLEIRNIISCSIVVLIVMVLMFKTDLFYQNPVLSLLGYNIYKIHINTEDFICIIRENLVDGDCVRKKKISRNIYVARKIK